MLSSGFQLSGADLLIHGNIPQGTGLSSSASLEVATARALTGFSGESLDGPGAARFGQRAENEFVGIQCGIMDQLVSACGMDGHATLIDCRSLDIRPVRLPDDAAIVVINSRIQRALESSDWQAIGELMAASHASMRYDFEITLPAIDELVEAVAQALQGVGGVRMTGGGFGGCMVAVVPRAKVDTVLAVVERGYPDGRKPAPVAYVCQPVQGAF